MIVPDPKAKPKDVGAMKPRELLQLLTYMGALFNVERAKADNPHVAHAKGPRGVKRRAKKARLNAHARRLQRVSWCVYGEALKKGGQA